ncbi:transcriptional regulator [Terrilactibacillus sp. BCM23-1]|uniref:Transcriptional regulator n=1 Tax=Terrilactibacillus tamarindi TaxID=2599694 RepID=A0A6N8CNT4_9BACI|nr:sugar diacid recognition domain-containing protein [Terrilactibacillus tamarindi]MTT31814.1 transcriptional regulator [Terrilactibacillus tamarindi]
MLLKDIAQNIVESTSEIIGHPITLIDDEGFIIGSTDRKRIGSFHDKTFHFMESSDMIFCEEEESSRLDNVLPGVVTPIFFNNHKIGVLGITGEPNKVKKYTLLVKSHVEMLCHELFKQEVMTLESKMLDTLVQYLLHFDNESDIKQIHLYAQMLGYDLNTPRVCLIIDINMQHSKILQKEKASCIIPPLQLLQQDIQLYLQQCFMDSDQDIICLLNPEQFILLKSSNLDEDEASFIEKIKFRLKKFNKYLESKHGLSAEVSVGSLYNQIKHTHISYKNALKALSAGKKNSSKLKLYHYLDWKIAINILSEEISPYMKEILKKKIYQLLNHHNYDDLSMTFLAYCRCNMNLSQTARTLFIHRNSLVYRLEKISELTSLDLSDFEQCVLLYMAIKNAEHGHLSNHYPSETEFVNSL